MERKDFLRSLGAGAAFALTFPCINGCSNDENGNARSIPTGVDFTIDLNSLQGNGLQNNGDFILVDSDGDTWTDIVVAKNLEGNFIAASLICSHQQNPTVGFIEEEGGIYECSSHLARFDQNGTPLNTITSNPLKTFNTELNGNILRVFE